MNTIQHKVNFKQSNRFEFSFPSPRLVAMPHLEPSLPYYLPITGGRII